MRRVARPWLTAVRCFPVSESEARRSYPEFPDVAGFVEVLNRRGVRFVVIGGSAVQFWVPEMITHDVDFSPATDRANLERLSAALYELAARIRTDAVPEGLAFHHDAASFIGAKMFNLQCPKGAFDLAFEPAGGGYDHLAPRARVLKLRGVDIPVADLADVVASKELANRPKDLAVLPHLRAVLANRRGLGPRPPKS